VLAREEGASERAALKDRGIWFDELAGNFFVRARSARESFRFAAAAARPLVDSPVSIGGPETLGVDRAI
jgi:hypothetical protein